MDITLNQDEIETAIKEFIGNEGINVSNKVITVSLTAGRSPNGHSASVILTPITDLDKKVAKEEVAQVPEVIEEEAEPAPEKKKPAPKPRAKKTEPVVEDVLEENTVELKEQLDEGGFEITEDGPAELELEPELETIGAGDEEDDSLFGA